MSKMSYSINRLCRAGWNVCEVDGHIEATREDWLAELYSDGEELSFVCLRKTGWKDYEKEDYFEGVYYDTVKEALEFVQRWNNNIDILRRKVAGELAASGAQV